MSICTSFVLKGFTSFKRNLKTIINRCFPFQLKKWGSVFKYLYIGSINFVFCVTSLWRPKLACMLACTMNLMEWCTDTSTSSHTAEDVIEVRSIPIFKKMNPIGA